MLEYPPIRYLSIVSPFFNLVNAPYCQRIGATSDGVPLRRSYLYNNALWQRSRRSSNIFQKSAIMSLELFFFAVRATSTRLIVTTPLLTLY